MYKASFQLHKLYFKEPGGTSRGVLTSKLSYYLSVWNEDEPGIVGTGECSILPHLSIDDRPDLENKLSEVCGNINDYTVDLHHSLMDWPAVRFALETALIDLHKGGRNILFPSSFTDGLTSIPINGLIWMGNLDEMSRRIEAKLQDGFSCLKLKIGALDTESELSLLRSLRKRFSPETIELRVDANGAFTPTQAKRILEELAKLKIHSIEQPIRAGHEKEMATLCANTPVPIALDEELIGINRPEEKRYLLELIKPQYIILKPSLLGGIKASEEWIKHAKSLGTGWWVTSALEANTGLNAIAQWTATLGNPMPQGLGTGQVFSNNTGSFLVVENGHLHYRQPV